MDNSKRELENLPNAEHAVGALVQSALRVEEGTTLPEESSASSGAAADGSKPGDNGAMARNSRAAREGHHALGATNIGDSGAMSVERKHFTASGAPAVPSVAKTIEDIWRYSRSLNKTLKDVSQEVKKVYIGSQITKKASAVTKKLPNAVAKKRPHKKPLSDVPAAVKYELSISKLKQQLKRATEESKKNLELSESNASELSQLQLYTKMLKKDLDNAKKPKKAVASKAPPFDEPKAIVAPLKIEQKIQSLESKKAAPKKLEEPLEAKSSKRNDKHQDSDSKSLPIPARLRSRSSLQLNSSPRAVESPEPSTPNTTEIVSASKEPPVERVEYYHAGEANSEEVGGPEELEKKINLIRAEMNLSLPATKSWMRQYRQFWMLINNRMRELNFPSKPTEAMLKDYKRKLVQEKQAICKAVGILQYETLNSMKTALMASKKNGEETDHADIKALKTQAEGAMKELENERNLVKCMRTIIRRRGELIEESKQHIKQLEEEKRLLIAEKSGLKTKFEAFEKQSLLGRRVQPTQNVDLHEAPNSVGDSTKTKAGEVDTEEQFISKESFYLDMMRQLSYENEGLRETLRSLKGRQETPEDFTKSSYRTSRLSSSAVNDLKDPSKYQQVQEDANAAILSIQRSRNSRGSGDLMSCVSNGESDRNAAIDGTQKVVNEELDRHGSVYDIGNFLPELKDVRIDEVDQPPVRHRRLSPSFLKPRSVTFSGDVKIERQSQMEVVGTVAETPQDTTEVNEVEEGFGNGKELYNASPHLLQTTQELQRSEIALHSREVQPVDRQSIREVIGDDSLKSKSLLNVAEAVDANLRSPNQTKDAVSSSNIKDPSSYHGSPLLQAVNARENPTEGRHVSRMNKRGELGATAPRLPEKAYTSDKLSHDKQNEESAASVFSSTSPVKLTRRSIRYSQDTNLQQQTSASTTDLQELRQTVGEAAPKSPMEAEGDAFRGAQGEKCDVRGSEDNPVPEEENQKYLDSHADPTSRSSRVLREASAAEIALFTAEKQHKVDVIEIEHLRQQIEGSTKQRTAALHEESCSLGKQDAAYSVKAEASDNLLRNLSNPPAAWEAVVASKEEELQLLKRMCSQKQEALEMKKNAEMNELIASNNEQMQEINKKHQLELMSVKMDAANSIQDLELQLSRVVRAQQLDAQGREGVKGVEDDMKEEMSPKVLMEKLNEFQNSFKLKAEEYEHQMNAMHQAHESTVELLRNKFYAELKKRSEFYRVEVSTLKAEHTKEMQEEKLKANQRISKIVDEANEQHKLDSEEFLKQINDLKAKQVDELQRRDEANALEMHRKTRHRLEEIKALKEQLREQRNSSQLHIEESLNDMRDEHRRAMIASELHHEQHWSAMTCKYDEELHNARSFYESKLQSLEEANSRALEKSAEEFRMAISEQRLQFETALQQTKEDAQKEKSGAVMRYKQMLEESTYSAQADKQKSVEERAANELKIQALQRGIAQLEGELAAMRVTGKELRVKLEVQEKVLSEQDESLFKAQNLSKIKERFDRGVQVVMTAEERGSQVDPEMFEMLHGLEEVVLDETISRNLMANWSAEEVVENSRMKEETVESRGRVSRWGIKELMRVEEVDSELCVEEEEFVHGIVKNEDTLILDKLSARVDAIMRRTNQAASVSNDSLVSENLSREASVEDIEVCEAPHLDDVDASSTLIHRMDKLDADTTSSMQKILRNSRMGTSFNKEEFVDNSNQMSELISNESNYNRIPNNDLSNNYKTDVTSSHILNNSNELNASKGGVTSSSERYQPFNTNHKLHYSTRLTPHLAIKSRSFGNKPIYSQPQYEVPPIIQNKVKPSLNALDSLERLSKSIVARVKPSLSL